MDKEIKKRLRLFCPDCLVRKAEGRLLCDIPSDELQLLIKKVSKSLFGLTPKKAIWGGNKKQNSDLEKVVEIHICGDCANKFRASYYLEPITRNFTLPELIDEAELNGVLFSVYRV